MTLESLALPKDWHTVKLEALCSLVRGASPRPKGDPRYFGGPIPWISIADLSREEGKYLTRTKEGVTPAGARLSRHLPEGTLIVSNSATICVPKILGVAGCIHDGFVALTELSPKADIDYLFHFFNAVRDEVRAKNTQGVTQVNLNTGIFKAMDVPLPPLAEQRRIAEVLDRAEALRAKRRVAIAQLDTLPQAIFLDLFGDHTTILEQWPTKKLGELLDFLTSGSRGWAEYYAESGDLFIRIQNVRRDELVLDDVTYVNTPNTAEATRTRVQPGDVLLSITADLGRTAVIPEGIGAAFINQHLSILRTKRLVPRFLSAYLASPVGQRQVSGRNRQGVKAGLNFDDIRSFVVPFPPAELQREFARRIAAVEKLKAAHRASLAELNALFSALQHRAFRGEL